MSKKTKAPAANLPVPQSDTEAEAAIARIGKLTRKIEANQADVNNGIATLTEELGKAIAPLRKELKDEVAGLQVYCEAQKYRLTNQLKTKTVKFATGEVSWRSRPAAVKLNDKVETILERVRALGFKQFIRTKEEINKEAMLKDPKVAGSIAGIVIASAGEDFVVEPLETELSERLPS